MATPLTLPEKKAQIDDLILAELRLLFEGHKIEVLHFVRFLKEKQVKGQPEPEKKDREPGSMKGKIWISPDFDEPMEEFKDYM